MAFYTVVSTDANGVRRSTTLDAASKAEAEDVVAQLNAEIADQYQEEEYVVKEVTKD